MSLKETQTNAIKETLSAVLSDVRPSELFMVDEVFKPTVKISRQTDPIAFGGGIDVVLWIHPLFHFLEHLAGTTISSFAKHWGEELAKHVWSKEKSKPREKIDPNALQLMRRAMVQRLEKDGITTRDSERVADCMVGLFASRPSLLRTIVIAK